MDSALAKRSSLCTQWVQPILGETMKVGDLVRVFNERTEINELAYIKEFGRPSGVRHIMIVYLTGRCFGNEQFFSEFNVLPLKTEIK